MRSALDARQVTSDQLCTTPPLRLRGTDFDNETRYIEPVADVDVDFVDLRGIDPESDCLNAEPAIGYPAGQKLAGD